ncbi:hypothetical protein DSM106972_087930 [Dulcicalothrix desertica PCC 7102]|uniref:Uncharacterized protein n=1 Tax=Dulcicalothrix desertica PCC 7102 TaxID=232991 RepID=A0A3S1C437_9CYAN|nr:hypothetical protein [Dulcicalothrix desertica]RUS96251.1 hypothetical protein DSM106972_087930 [Dulcicalothrix desertica PCC 7102]TWH40424.1 hypothetical protein CAL7102_09751 [Dulcicalothrix desertica PCC 7102]
MSDAKIFLEICYAKEKFNPIYTLHSLSYFTELIGGLNVDTVAQEIPHWSNNNLSLKKEKIITIQEKLLQGELKFRVLFYFPESQELINALSQTYGKSVQEVKTYSCEGNVLLGYGTIYISLEEKFAKLRIFPDIDVLANMIMRTSLICSYLEKLCQETNALSAHWEDFDDEILMTIWSNKVAI